MFPRHTVPGGGTEEEKKLDGGGLRRATPLLAILAFAAVARFGFGVAAMDGHVPRSWMQGGDQYSYVHYGDQIARGHGYISYTNGRATAYYPIGWPATLAGVFWVEHHTPLPDDEPRAVALCNAAMSTATVFFVWCIASAALARRRALVATAIVAAFPSLILTVPTYMVETAFIFWATAALAVIATHDWSSGPPSNRRLLAFGTVLGLSVLTRPFAVPFVIGLAIALFVIGAGWRRVTVAAAVTLVPVVILMTPWTIRNAHAMHAFVPVSTNLGDTVCIDRWAQANGRFRFATQGCADPNLPEAQRNRDNLHRAESFVLHHPMKELWLMGQRFRFIMANDRASLTQSESVNGRIFTPSERHVAVTVIDWYFRAVMVLGLVGLVGLVRSGARRPQRLLVATAVVTMLWIPLELWGSVRFHLPLLPFAAIAAAAAPLAFRPERDREATLEQAAPAELVPLAVAVPSRN